MKTRAVKIRLTLACTLKLNTQENCINSYRKLLCFFKEQEFFITYSLRCSLIHSKVYEFECLFKFEFEYEFSLEDKAPEK